MSVPKMGLGSFSVDDAGKAHRGKTRDDLVKLRDALAAATKNDFALDIAIECVLFGATERTWDPHVRVQTAERAYNPPNYTASIDAAATLVMPLLAEGVIAYVDVNIELPPPHSAGTNLQLTFDSDRPSIIVGAATQQLAWCLARVDYEIAILAEKGE